MCTDAIAGARRASGELALHVLEVMTALTAGVPERMEISSRPAIPSIVPLMPAEVWRGE